MAWRPTQYVQEGELDNSCPKKVTGWIKFAGMKAIEALLKLAIQ